MGYHVRAPQYMRCGGSLSGPHRTFFVISLHGYDLFPHVQFTSSQGFQPFLHLRRLAQISYAITSPFLTPLLSTYPFEGLLLNSRSSSPLAVHITHARGSCPVIHSQPVLKFCAVHSSVSLIGPCLVEGLWSYLCGGGAMVTLCG